MQKKSLLVALFCGALCLTGCLKNEESASVAQVRIAKANELNSLAELNKAKAQAEVIYANAEATLKNAQAELEKANAALVLAQAETEKVKAQLLAVQVKLAEVKVEEEKVTLRMMQADLESRLAFLEAEKAAAEAAKQAWVNVLNDLLAKAEIGAIENAKEILEAEQKLEDYILTQAGKKADSAKYYSKLYFAALKDVERAQVKELEAKAARVLVNQGAILAREYIHEEIEAANDTIAMNQAFIDALKEKQTMSPEEAQAALQEARLAAGEAYAAYIEALKAENEARTAANEAFDKEADFTKGWYGNFISDIDEILNLTHQSEIVTVGEGDAERVKLVRTTGIRVWSEENGREFIPLWNREVIDTTVIRYPAADVVAPGHKTLKDIRVIPATINYDNIKEALDAAVERKEAQAQRNIDRRERQINRQIAALEEDIAVWEDTIALHKAYLAARKDSVTKYEQAFLKARAAADGKDEAVNEAWDAFQLYMLTKYPTVSRSLFIARNTADTNYTHAKAKFLVDSAKIVANIQDTVDLKTKVKEAFEAYAKARGVVVRIADSLFDPESEAGAIYAGKLVQAKSKWSPEFADATDLKDPVHGELLGNGTADPFKGIPIYKWSVTPQGSNQAIYAGASQDTTLSVEFAINIREAQEYNAKIAYWAGAGTKEAWDKAKADLKYAQDALDPAIEHEADFWQTYANYYGDMVEALDIDVTIEAAFDAFHQNASANRTQPSADREGKDIVPGFPTWNSDVLKDFVSFPTDGAAAYNDPNRDYRIYPEKLEEGEWTDAAAAEIEKAGTAQIALIEAVKNVLDARVINAKAQSDLDGARSRRGQAELAYESANNALIRALGGDPATDEIEDFIDSEAEGLYQKYLAALKETTNVYSSYFTLLLVYLNGYWDEVGPNRPADFPNIIRSGNYGKLNFSWAVSSYMVDPEATYLGFDGEDESIAELLFPRRGKQSRHNYNPYRNSLQWKVDNANNTIEVVLPKQLADYTDDQMEDVEDLKEDVADIMAAVNAYKSTETGYQNWVEEREAAYDNYNEAKIARWAAEDVQEEAEIEYESIDAVANEGIYVYDPNHELDEFVNDSEAASHSRGNNDYVKISIAKQIELLEEDNERLETKVQFLRNVLTDGKKVLAVVNEIIDQKIEQLSEEVAIKTALALQYKEIMNAYLGFVDEEVDGETGPLDGEGDDEE